MKTKLLKPFIGLLLAITFVLPMSSCGNAHSYWGVDSEYGYAGGEYGPQYGRYRTNPDHHHHKHKKHKKHKKYKKYKKHHHEKRKHNPNHRYPPKHRHNPDHHHHHDD